MEKFEYKEEYGWPTNACLNLTDSCNLACVYCTPRDTIVATTTGDKSVQDIKVGDEVISFPEDGTREIRKSRVTKTVSRQTDTLIQITTESGDDIYITKEHPMLEKKGWVWPKDLLPHYFTLVLYNGNFYESKIKEIKIHRGNYTVYNLETTEHTYIANNFCVHNCFVQQNPHFMSLDTAKKAVLWLLDNLKKKQENDLAPKDGKVNITYFGGEPMLCWDTIIVPLTDWVKENNFPVKFSMTSNGTLLYKDRLDYMAQNKISLLLSMDGAEYTQNINRPAREGSSFDQVYKNIPDIIGHYPILTFRGTINQETVDKTFENFIFARDMGFSSCFFIPNCREKWSQKNTDTLIQQLKKIFLYIKYTWTELDEDINICFSPMYNFMYEIVKYGKLITLNKAFNYENIKRKVQVCGLATTMCAIGFNGDIYGCQEQVSYGYDGIFLVGNILNGGIDKAKHSKLVAEYNKQATMRCAEPEYCNECSFRPFCITEGCRSVNYDTNKDFFINPKIFCVWKNYLYQFTLELMQEMTEQENIHFYNFLEKNARRSRR